MLRKLAGIVSALALGAAASAAATEEGKDVTVKRVGLIVSASRDQRGHLEREMVESLKQQGYVQGKNLVLEVRYANGDMSLVPKFANEFETMKLDAVVTTCSPTTSAMKAASSSRIPIVMAAVTDPVGQGLVQSLSRPGGNVTGTASQFDDAMPKMIELFATVLPRGASVAVLANERNPVHARLWESLSRAASGLGLRMTRIGVTGGAEIPQAMQKAAAAGTALFLLPDDPMFFNQRARIVELAKTNRLAGFYYAREFVELGGLISYGENMAGSYRRAAGYVDRILHGAKPGDLAIEQPTTFELWVNLAAAKALGVNVPQTVLLQADRVLE